MNNITENKYKDELPLKTINKIRNILNDLGIFTIETNWKNSADGFYSVTIKIVDTNLQTNGKGTSYEYALASGYAELLERLQNRAQFKLSIDVSDKALRYKGFFYAPDEKYLSIKDLLKEDEDWIKYQLNSCKSIESKEKLLVKWKEMTNNIEPNDYTCLPYLNLKTKNISNIPIKMVSKMYMSNGMCAGNTTEEAIVQGLSEVLERAVNRKIILEKLTPPDIPESYLSNFPKIVNMINKIKGSGNFEVIMKDCSLGKGYPVVGTIFINKDSQSYFVKFGSHPKIEIALERSLTELLQGQDVKQMMGLKEFSFKSNIGSKSDNLMGILVNGSGYYPTELFTNNYSYEFSEYDYINGMTNKEMLLYLINLIERDGYDIYVRDMSFLGFPSFHVLVSGLSEVEQIDDVKSLESYLEYLEVKKYIRKYSSLNDTEINELIESIESKYNGNGSVINLLNLPIKNVFPWYYVNLNLYLTAIYYKKGEYKYAFKCIDEFINKFSPNQFNQTMMIYYKCVRDYIAAKSDDLEDVEIVNLLSKFYSMNVVNGVLFDFGDEDIINSKYGEINCFDCSNCNLNEHCSYLSVERVYKILKDRFSKCKISQRNLLEVIKK